MKRVLLTGASGFVGRHCLGPLAARGYEVHAVARSSKPADVTDGARWQSADLLESDQVRSLMAKVEPTHLLHLAWNASPGIYMTSLDNLRWVQASLELYLTFVAHGGQRSVCAGTCIEYDLREGQCSEATTPLVPTTLYGSCKHALHVTTEAFAREVGLSTAWARVFFLYGPHEYPTRLVASIIRSVLTGETVNTTHGRQLRDFLHVEDAASALVALLDSDIEGAVNIASGKAVPLSDVFDEIAERTGRRDLIHIGALQPPANEPPLICADTNRLCEEVGWTPNYDLARGMEETINWWRLQLNAPAAEETRRA